MFLPYVITCTFYTLKIRHFIACFLPCFRSFFWLVKYTKKLFLNFFSPLLPNVYKALPKT